MVWDCWYFPAWCAVGLATAGNGVDKAFDKKNFVLIDTDTQLEFQPFKKKII